MTFEQAKQLSHGQVIHHKTLKNSDKTSLRARVNGKIQLWKTRPNEIKIPMIHGLRDYFYLTQDNLHEWDI